MPQRCARYSLPRKFEVDEMTDRFSAIISGVDGIADCSAYLASTVTVDSLLVTKKITCGCFELTHFDSFTTAAPIEDKTITFTETATVTETTIASTARLGITSTVTSASTETSYETLTSTTTGIVQGVLAPPFRSPARCPARRQRTRPTLLQSARLGRTMWRPARAPASRLPPSPSSAKPSR